METEAVAGSLSPVERLQALLSIAESITSCRDPEELFHRLARHLRRVVRFDRLGLVLLHPEHGISSVRVLETTGREFTTLADHAVEGTHSGWVIEMQRPLIVPDTAAETRWPQAMAELREHGIVALCGLPLTTARRRIGALGFGSRAPVTYTAPDIAFLGHVAKLVAVAVDNALDFDEVRATQRQLSTERDHLRLLLDVTNDALRRYASVDVRELASIVERTLVHSKGRTLEVPSADLKQLPRAEPHDGTSTLEAVERMHILRVLAETNWTLGGPRGAATRLGMKRTTLQSLMQRLGITRPRAA